MWRIKLHFQCKIWCLALSRCHVCLICCSEISLTDELINDRNLFLTVLESGKSTIKTLAYAVAVKDLLSVCTWYKQLFLVVPSCIKRD